MLMLSNIYGKGANNLLCILFDWTYCLNFFYFVSSHLLLIVWWTFSILYISVSLLSLFTYCHCHWVLQMCGITKQNKKKKTFFQAHTEVLYLARAYPNNHFKDPFDRELFSPEPSTVKCVQMRDPCHGISSADLLYNRFSDNTSCCPATCFVSQGLCRCTQFHGSFTSAQHFKNKYIPINQSKTFRTKLERTVCLRGSSFSYTQGEKMR